jgi:hypothetical protein
MIQKIYSQNLAITSSLKTSVAVSEVYGTREGKIF